MSLARAKNDGGEKVMKLERGLKSYYGAVFLNDSGKGWNLKRRRFKP